MRLAWALLLASAFSEQIASAADISGRVIDAETGGPIPRARVAIHVSLNGGEPAGVALLTDAMGGFRVTNLPDGNWQLSGEKAGYLSASLMLSGDTRSTPIVLRLPRQAVIEGSVIDEKGRGVSFASVQLFRQVVANGRHQIQPSNGTQTDQAGEFRIFGLAAGRYYLGAAGPTLRPAKLVYAPILYPGATDISSAQAIDLQPGTEEHVKISLRAVPAHRVRGTISHGRSANAWLHPQESRRFPVTLNLGASCDEKTNTFTISGVPPGRYVLEGTVQIDGQQLRMMKTISVDDADLEGIVLEPASLPEVTGRVTKDGRAAMRGEISQIQLRSLQGQFAAQIEDNGTFHFSDLLPDTYHVAVSPTGSAYVQSIRQGGRDVEREGIVIGQFPPDPLEIGIGSHGGTIDGAIAVSGSHTKAVIVGLFRSIGGELVFDRQTHSVLASSPGTSSARFSLQGIAPGEYVLLAWPSDAQIAYAEPEFMRQYYIRGKAVRVTEDARLSVILDELLPNMDR
jgi:Carboxypeptidase regulatory-like domain